MGDRGNIFFVDRREGDVLAGVYMYTHWSGSMLPGIVRDALIRGRGRWGDAQYLARIVFCELVKDAVLEETGYGLGTYLGDNEHNVVRIDDLASRVSFHEAGKERRADDPGLAAWSYEEFVAARSAPVERAFLGEPAAEPAAPPRARGAAKGNGKAKPAARAGAKANGTKAPRGNGRGKGKHAARAGAKPARRRAGSKS